MAALGSRWVAAQGDNIQSFVHARADLPCGSWPPMPDCAGGGWVCRAEGGYRRGGSRHPLLRYGKSAAGVGKSGALYRYGELGA